MSSKIVFDMAILGYIKAFEKITHAAIRDCIAEDERIIFVVEKGELGKALGKKAENLHRASELLKKKVKVVEYSDDLLGFVKNFIHPLKVDAMHEEDGIVVLESTDTKTKGLLIGRAAQNLRKLETYVKRFFPSLKEIKVA